MKKENKKKITISYRMHVSSTKCAQVVEIQFLYFSIYNAAQIFPVQYHFVYLNPNLQLIKNHTIRASQLSLIVKNLPGNAGDIRDLGWIPGLRKSPGEGNGSPLQYSCLKSYMDRVDHVKKAEPLFMRLKRPGHDLATQQQTPQKNMA